MSEQRDLFSKSVVADQAELKANAALYAARERAGVVEEEETHPFVTAPPRVIRQGGAEAARALRERLVAEHRAVVVEAAARLARREQGIPARSILKFRLSDLPRLVRPDRDPPKEDGR